MISSLLNRFVPPASTSTPQTTSASPAVSTPAPAPYFQDGFDPPQASPVRLDGGASASPLANPSLLKSSVLPVGPKLQHLEDGWIPQGQGYDAKRGEVLTTYYRDLLPGPVDLEFVRLSIQDKTSGKETHSAMLGGTGEFPPPSHGGGVSTDGKYVYVADTDGIYTYTREDIVEAGRNGTFAEPISVVPVPADTVDPADPKTGLVSNGSYMTVKDGYAYVGGYSEDGDGKAGALWRYKINEKTGEFIQGENWPQGPIRAPDRAQGIAVVDGALLFTTGDHKLVYQPFDMTSFKADIEQRNDISNGLIDPYAQGLNIIDGELWVTYESGADKYKDKVDSPREHIQRIPLELLDLESVGLTPEELMRLAAGDGKPKAAGQS